MSINYGGRGAAPLFRAALVVVGSVVCATLAFAGPEWLEGGKKNGADAGSTPGNEDQPMGLGDMEAIRGTLRAFAQGTAAAGPLDFQDLYLICIQDPEVFLASTINPLNGYAEGFDSRLYLFDMNGNPLLSNDNTQLPLGGVGLVGGVVPESTVENMSNDGTEVMVLESGLYLLGIGDTSTAPKTEKGAIFFYGSETETSGPDGPGGDGGPLDSWCPTGACCLPNNTCAIAAEDVCNLADGEYQGDGVECDEMLCAPTGACCLPDESCTISAQLECAQAGGAFQGVNTACDKRTCLPQGACCLEDDTCLQLNTLACARAGGVYLGDGTFCDETTCLPEGACCLTDNTCVVTNSLDCDDSGGDYQGDKSRCDPQLCLPVGACCLADTSCIETNLLDCKDSGGAFFGAGSVCTDRLCLPVGACCLPDDSCIQTNRVACSRFGGKYQGDGEICEKLLCVPVGACCLPDNSCIETDQASCESDGGEYQGDKSTCDPQLCLPIGACCLVTDTCIVTDENDCNGFSGEYQGDRSRCDDQLCLPVGACCLEDGGCIDVNAPSCGQAGGEYQGDRSSCDRVTCVVPTGACCLTLVALGEDQPCLDDLTEDECAATSGGSYQGDDTTCTDTDIACAVGACCLTGGKIVGGQDCVDGITEAQCSDYYYYGTFQGGGTTCADPDIDCPVGACCASGYGDLEGTGGGGSTECIDNISEASCNNYYYGGVFQGAGTNCSDPDIDCPIGACCIGGGEGVEGGTVTCIELTESQCLDYYYYYGNGVYQGPGTNCSDPDIDCPIGACCFGIVGAAGGGGGCSVITEEQCTAGSGVFQGAGTTCNDLDIDCPIGACCLSEGSTAGGQPGGCNETTEDQCTSFGGTYQGAGSDCSDLDIDCPSGACCLSNGTVGGGGCSQLTEDQCVSLYYGGVFQGGGTTCNDLDIDCPKGACCVFTEGYGGPGCFNGVTEDSCVTNLGGVFQGAGSNCFDPDIDCPLGACCVTQLPDLVGGGGGSGCFDNLTEDQCTAMGAYAVGVFQGPGSSCSDLDIDCPSGACCLNGGPASVGIGGCIDNITEVECTSPYYGAPGVFQGAGTTCDDPRIDCPEGACCITNEYGTSCENGLTQAECEASYAFGIFLGAGSTCPDASCMPTGGCCLPDTSCVVTDEADCEGQGGIYQGDGSACNSCYPAAGPPPAPGDYRIVLDGVCFAQSVPEGACDLPEGGCVITNEFNCVMVALGKFQGAGTFCQTNDNCDAAEPIVEGSTPFDTTGATTDGPPHAACERFGNQQIDQDIWYDYIPGCEGTLTVSLCGSDFDTKLAIYEGCVCPVGDFNLIDCDDDGCGPTGGPSTVTLPVTGDSCYKVRIGGFGGEKGTGVAELSLTPDQEQEPSLVLNVDPKVGFEVGGPYVVTLQTDDLCGTPAAGFQAFLEYDPLAIEFQSATYTTTPFGLNLITGGAINPIPGQLDLASGINQTIGQLPTSSPDRVDLVVLEFTALSCDAAVTFRKNVPPSRITDPAGNEIPANLIDTPVPQCPGDVNGDGEVGVSDLITTLNDWGTANCQTDGNNDGDVNVIDLIDVIVNWGPCP